MKHLVSVALFLTVICFKNRCRPARCKNKQNNYDFLVKAFPYSLRRYCILVQIGLLLSLALIKYLVIFSFKVNNTYCKTALICIVFFLTSTNPSYMQTMPNKTGRSRGKRRGSFCSSCIRKRSPRSRGLYTTYWNYFFKSRKYWPSTLLDFFLLSIQYILLAVQ